MTTFLVDVSSQARLPAPVETAWAAIADVPDMAALMGVRRCTPIQGGWRWDLGERGALGRSVQVLFDVATTQRAPHEVVFEPIGDAARWASGRSVITLTAAGAQTDVTVRLPLSLDLPIPRLLGGPIGSVIRREMQQMLDGFLARWAEKIDGPA